MYQGKKDKHTHTYAHTHTLHICIMKFSFQVGSTTFGDHGWPRPDISHPGSCLFRSVTQVPREWIGWTAGTAQRFTGPFSMVAWTCAKPCWMLGPKPLGRWESRAAEFGWLMCPVATCPTVCWNLSLCCSYSCWSWLWFWHIFEGCSDGVSFW